jgi:hypothetical protein
MIRPGFSKGYRAITGNTGSDTDALQTDVMRFMSILGLCLMAVFALVQAIPLQETEAPSPDPDRKEPISETTTRQEPDPVLQANLDNLMAQIHNAETRKLVAQRALSSTQQQLNSVINQTERARGEQQRLEIELDDLQHRIEKKRNDLSSAENNKSRLDTAQPQRTERRIRIDDISRRASILKKTPPSAAHEAETTKPLPSAPTPEKKGFTLRFASNDALEKLVASRKVSLFAMLNKKAWRLSVNQGRPSFSNAAFPGWFHEMASSTVPARYVRALNPSINPGERSQVTWGVQLPPETRREITSLTGNIQGGTLVIGADGRVTLEPE